MKGKKIDISDYESEVRNVDSEGKLEIKSEKMRPRYLLPWLICNPNLGNNDRGPDPAFDLMKLGPISKMIDVAKDDHIVLSDSEYNVLKTRAETVSKFFGYAHYEMFRRIYEAPEIELEEKK